MALKSRFGFNTQKFFTALLVSFIAIQIGSWLLSELMGYPLLKGGPMLLLFLVIIGLVSLFVLGRKLGDLSIKKDGLFILLVFGAIIAAFIFLPKYIPQIFSIQSLEIKEFLREVIGTIAEVGTGVV